MALVKYNNNSISTITTAGQLASGSMVLIKEQTASSSSSISFVDGSSSVVLDSTYPIYLFKFINIHPATNSTAFRFNLSVDTGSNYNVAKTSSHFQTRHDEDDSPTQLAYETGKDLAQGTGFQQLVPYVGTGNDESVVGELFLFNPSSTTFVKHFMAQTNGYGTDGSNNSLYGGFAAGYFNTTSAINAVQFKFDSGEIQGGTIDLFGVV